MREKLNRFVLALRKLGILRYGGTTYKYTSDRDMPARALMDNVYDEKKDLVTRDEMSKK